LNVINEGFVVTVVDEAVGVGEVGAAVFKQ